MLRQKPRRSKVYSAKQKFRSKTLQKSPVKIIEVGNLIKTNTAFALIGDRVIITTLCPSLVIYLISNTHS